MTLGTIVFIAPLFFTPKPTLNPVTLDRAYLFSGEADAYWKQVMTHFKPGDRYAVIEDFGVCYFSKVGVPNILTGSHNYPMYFKLPAIEGYSPTAPKDQLFIPLQPAWTVGAFLPSQKEELLREMPNLKIITLVSITPLKITLSSRNEPTIDLTPYLDSK